MRPVPCSDPPCGDEDCEAHVDWKLTLEDHRSGIHKYCNVDCEDAMPSQLMYNSIVVYGLPGTKGMLNELMKRAAEGRDMPDRVQ